MTNLEKLQERAQCLVSELQDLDAKSGEPTTASILSALLDLAILTQDVIGQCMEAEHEAKFRREAMRAEGVPDAE